jgi:hypothetical protein
MGEEDNQVKIKKLQNELNASAKKDFKLAAICFAVGLGLAAFYFLYLGFTQPIIVSSPYFLLVIICGASSYFLMKWGSFKASNQNEEIFKIKRICIYCKKPIPNDADFCSHCGKRLSN